MHYNNGQKLTNLIWLIVSYWIVSANECVVELKASGFDHFVEPMRTIAINGQFQKSGKYGVVIVFHRKQLSLLHIFIAWYKRMDYFIDSVPDNLNFVYISILIYLLLLPFSTSGFPFEVAVPVPSLKYFVGIMFRISGNRFVWIK